MTMKLGSIFVALGATALVTACSSSPTPFEALDGKANAMADRLLELDITPVESMPEGGTATFNGFIGIGSGTLEELEALGEDELPEGAVIGELTLVATFADGFVDGTASNFLGENSEAFGGELDIVQDVVEFEPAEFEGTIDGTLTNGGDEYLVDLDSFGIFLGLADGQPEGLAGFADGTIQENALEPELAVGVFIAEIE